MSDATIEYNAKQISDIIKNTDTELRGNLFYEVARELKKNNQHATALMVMELAHNYGIKS